MMPPTPTQEHLLQDLFKSGAVKAAFHNPQERLTHLAITTEAVEALRGDPRLTEGPTSLSTLQEWWQEDGLTDGLLSVSTPNTLTCLTLHSEGITP